MVCPFRVKEVRETIDNKTIVSQEFSSCYGSACPYFATGYVGTVTCLKIEKENKK